LTPEEVVELSPAALGPGQIDTVITSIRCHHEATRAACVVYSIMIYAKTEKTISKTWFTIIQTIHFSIAA